TLLSVWGSDVFEFPYQSRARARLIRFNLRSASRVASTSLAMARQVQALVPDIRPPTVTPFGVDCDRFAPQPARDDGVITIGTVKVLEHRYGIDLLIEAFGRLQRDHSLIAAGVAHRLRLTIVGDGVDRRALEAQADRWCKRGTVDFIGSVPHHEVPRWLNRFDVYVAASRIESFGVAVVEASACGIPVVVSDVGGLPEV